MGPTSLTLYGYWRSSSSYRVRAALELKGLAYRYEPIHLLDDGGHQHREGYRELNPMRQVPTLVHERDGERHVIAQSVAICELLEELFPSPALLPKNPWRRAQVRTIVEVVNSGIQPIANLGVLRHLGRALGQSEAARNDWIQHWIRVGFDGLERLIQSSAGRFAVGDTPTLADCFVVPQVYNARRYAVDLTAYPTIARIEGVCLELPAFQRALPEHQPDAPST
jgi:maleylacetoacetate isomerase